MHGVNSRGAGAWSSTVTFTTIPPNVLFTLSRTEFGTVARLDTSAQTMTLQNVSSASIVVERVVVDSSHFSLATLATTRLLPQASLRIPALFFPQRLGVLQSSVRVEYRTEASNGVLSGVQGVSLSNRLVGTGLGLKVLAPNFDTVLVGQTRIVPAFVINRSFHSALLNQMTISSLDSAYDFVSDIDNKGVENIAWKQHWCGHCRAGRICCVCRRRA
ncbi:MAG: hypothetical protein EAZ92_12690 [Candidatus Kapaibacterium sp.]|nr:MAG: hypothetical protein EAZ92_12690 [Candidatus Kapabacteria bacterium]